MSTFNLYAPVAAGRLPAHLVAICGSGTLANPLFAMLGVPMPPGVARLRAGDHNAILIYLRDGGDVDARTGEHDETMLMIASAHGHVRIVEVCLSQGANVKLAASDGTTALHRASLYARVPIVCRLLEAQADPNALSKLGYTPLFDVATGGSTDPLPAGDGSPGMPLPAAVRDAEHVKCIKILLDANASINFEAGGGVTPVMAAAAKGRTSVVIGMLEAGVDPTYRNRFGLDVISVAHCHNQLSCAQAIKAFKASALAEQDASRRADAFASRGLAWRRVQVVGLSAKPELNGLCGSASTFHSSSGRVEVMLDNLFGEIRYNHGKAVGPSILVRPANLQPVSSPPAGANGAIERFIFQTSSERYRCAKNAFINFQEKFLPTLAVMSWPNMWPAPPGNTILGGAGAKIAMEVAELEIPTELMPEDLVDDVELVHQLWLYKGALREPEAIIIPAEACPPKVEIGRIGNVPTELIDLVKPGLYDPEAQREVVAPGGFTRAEFVAAIALHLQKTHYGMAPATTGVGSPSYAGALLMSRWSSRLRRPCRHDHLR